MYFKVRHLSAIPKRAVLTAPEIIYLVETPLVLEKTSYFSFNSRSFASIPR